MKTHLWELREDYHVLCIWAPLNNELAGEAWLQGFWRCEHDLLAFWQVGQLLHAVADLHVPGKHRSTHPLPHSSVAMTFWPSQQPENRFTGDWLTSETAGTRTACLKCDAAHGHLIIVAMAPKRQHAEHQSACNAAPKLRHSIGRTDVQQVEEMMTITKLSNLTFTCMHVALVFLSSRHTVFHQLLKSSTTKVHQPATVGWQVWWTQNSTSALQDASVVAPKLELHSHQPGWWIAVDLAILQGDQSDHNWREGFKGVYICTSSILYFAWLDEFILCTTTGCTDSLGHLSNSTEFQAHFMISSAIISQYVWSFCWSRMLKYGKDSPT